jgi:hypothetical protein
MEAMTTSVRSAMATAIQTIMRISFLKVRLRPRSELEFSRLERVTVHS